MRRLIYILPLLFVVALVGVFVIGLRRDPSVLPSTFIGKPAPDFAVASVRPGEAALSKAALGGKPRILNVFASWCVACRVEHPLLLALKAQGVEVIGLDWKDDPTAGAAYLQRQGDPYARVGSDPTGRTGINFGVAGVPETFILDAAGVVRYKVVGPITPQMWNGTLQPLMMRLGA